MAEIRIIGIDSTTGRRVVGSPGDTTVPASGGGTASNTVTGETSFGVTPIAGSSSDYSRGDHTHGTPANPINTAFTGLANITVGTSAPGSPASGDLWVDTN
jgi:hypothetical protein